jgi:hypothetical protein
LAFTIVRVASGGLPVVESERGLPYYEADNGYGIPVTFGDSGIPLGSASIADWFVDSVAGSDSNTGKTAAQAFQTIGALVTAVGSKTGQRIALKCGSSWKEQLLLTNNASTRIFSYGSGDQPLLDASDNIPNASFSLVGGTTATYQASVTYAGTTGSSTQSLVWENGVNLVQVAYVAGAELSTPGTFAFSSYSGGSATLLVRASDSSDITTNGKTYDFTKRYAALMITGDNCTITNIRTRRQRANDGSAVVYGDNTWFYNCTMEDGHKHAAYVGEGGGFSGCTFKNVYNGTSLSPNFIVFNKNVGTQLGMNVLNCTFTQDPAVVPSASSYPVSAANATSVIAHVNTSGDFGILTATGNTHTNMATGYSLTNATTQNITSDTFVNSQRIANANYAGTINVSNTTFTFSIAPSQVGVLEPVVSTISAGNAIVNYSNVTASTGTYDWRISGNNLASNFTNCNITAGNTSGRSPLGLLRTTGTGGALALNGCHLTVGYTFDSFVNLATDTTYTGDNNIFTGLSTRWRWARNNVNVVDNTTSGSSAIAAWQAYTTNAAAGHDAASTAN